MKAKLIIFFLLVGLVVRSQESITYTYNINTNDGTTNLASISTNYPADMTSNPRNAQGDFMLGFGMASVWLLFSIVVRMAKRSTGASDF